MASPKFPIRSVLVGRRHGWPNVSHQVSSCMESWLVESFPSGQILYGGVMAGQKFAIRSDLVWRRHGWSKVSRQVRSCKEAAPKFNFKSDRHGLEAQCLVQTFFREA